MKHKENKYVKIGKARKITANCDCVELIRMHCGISKKGTRETAA